MASSIASLTAGGGGIAMTADSSGNLNLLSGTTTILALTATGVAVTGTLSASTPMAVASGGTGVATSTGSGANVLGTSPTLTTPTFDSASLVTISGTAPLYMCRAWVNFNGSGTVAIRASGNVSSITDNGTGDYTVNFTTAMADANYTAVTNTGRAQGGSGIWAYGPETSVPTTSAWRLNTLSSSVAATDAVTIYVAFFR